MLLSGRPFFLLSLAAVFLQAAPDCAGEKPPPEPVPYALTYRLELNHAAEGKVVTGLPDAVTFRSASGHELTHVVQQATTGARVTVRGWDPVRLAAAESTGAEAFSAWRNQVATLGTCPEGVVCDPSAEWAKSGPALSLDGTLTALTEDGEWLFRYTFTEAWPTSAVSAPGVLLELGLATRLGRVDWNPQHPFFTELKTVYSITGGDGATGLTVTDAVTGRDIFGLRAQALGIDSLLASLDAAYEHPGMSSRRVAASGPRRSYTGGRFLLELDGAVAGGFLDLGGLEAEIEVVEYRNGDDPITHKRPGKAKYKNLVLKRGSASSGVLEAYKKVLAGTTERKSGSIIYLDREGNEVLRYNFFEAWPCRWKAPELNSSSDTHIVEELEFAVERVERG
ncbi:MAG: phage tail protein [Myxococcota bacterium]|nr:phage tail protein [Myxococcota bacterium]